MALKTGQEYVASLRELKPQVYAFGKRIENPIDHPLIRPHVNCAAQTYDLAFDPHHSRLAIAKSHLTGKPINRFTHIHQSTEDLINKVKMLRLLGQRTGSCFQRCVGFDALNALYITTFEMDQDLGTSYHSRFRRFLEWVQDNDLMCVGAMTDPKGDRSLAPSQQADPDLYLRVVEKNTDGIVVRGAKMHQTGAVNAHQLLVMPTIGMRPGDESFAVSFATATDTPGVVMIFGRQTNDTRRLEGTLDQGNAHFGSVGGEALVIFDDVFVPWDRVFMCGETTHTGALVERFASLHRQNYGGCKTGLADVLIGATRTLAEYNGTLGASHVKDKLVEMVHLAESLYAGSLACSAEGRRTPSGAYYVDGLLANVTKLNVTRNVYEIVRLAQDLAGGLIATLPSEQDLQDPKLGPLVRKYLKGNASVPAEDRYRIARLIENMTGGTALVESMHGAGSPQAERIMILRQANLDQKKQLALRLAGITPLDAPIESPHSNH